MKQASIALVGMVLSVWGVAGCGRSEAPAAAATPAAPLRNLNVVRIPLDSPQLKQIHVEAVRQVNMPSDELVAPGRLGARGPGAGGVRRPCRAGGAAAQQGKPRRRRCGVRRSAGPVDRAAD